VLLGRLMDVGTELFAISSACSYAQHLGTPEATTLADRFARDAQVRIDRSFRGVSVNADDSLRGLADEVLDGKHLALEDGIA